MKCDISVILNAHREAEMIRPTLRSIVEAAGEARSRGKTVEILVVLDRGDDRTRKLVSDWSEQEQARVIEADNADLGLSRNDGVREAKGEWVGFIDADDLWGKNWLADAHDSDMKEPRASVWHPELNLYFGVEPYIYVHIDMDSPEFDMSMLVASNYWTALSFTRRELLEKYPYPRTDLKSQFGFEDWSWNMLTAKHGVVHKIVPNTGHVIRQRQGSLVRSTTAALAIPRTSGLFRKILRERDEAVRA